MKKNKKFSEEDYIDLKRDVIEGILDFREYYFIPDDFTNTQGRSFEPVKRETLEETDMVTLLTLFKYLIEKLAKEYGYYISKDYERLIRL